MAFPVRVYNPQGQLTKVITTEMLEQRFNAKIEIEIASERSSKPIVELVCQYCGNIFFGHKGFSKYCIGGNCAKKVKQGQDQVNSKRKRERDRK